MEKEESNLNDIKQDNSEKNEVSDIQDSPKDNSDENNEKKELSAEEKILELEDKLARTFAEMENQRRRFEKEKEDAFEYGGYSFAKEALNLIDNLERSKVVLQNDESLKDTDALKKMLDHFDIINKDLISIFSKNNIKPIESLIKR
jgi:molecular chaperone GrpE